MTATAFLQMHGIPFYRDASRRMIVPGALRCRGLNLMRLPDLTGVIVEGDVSFADNLLASLKGMPRVIRGNVDVSDNLLQDLSGAPRVLTGTFSCTANKLSTLADAPRGCRLVTDFGTFDHHAALPDALRLTAAEQAEKEIRSIARPQPLPRPRALLRRKG